MCVCVCVRVILNTSWTIPTHSSSAFEKRPGGTAAVQQQQQSQRYNTSEPHIRSYTGGTLVFCVLPFQLATRTPPGISSTTALRNELEAKTAVVRGGQVARRPGDVRDIIHSKEHAKTSYFLIFCGFSIVPPGSGLAETDPVITCQIARP